MVSITYGQCYSEKSADNQRYEDGEHYLRTVRRAQTIHDMRMVSITYGQCYSEKSADNQRYEDGEHYPRTVLHNILNGWAYGDIDSTKTIQN